MGICSNSKPISWNPIMYIIIKAQFEHESHLKVSIIYPKVGVKFVDMVTTLKTLNPKTIWIFMDGI